MHMIICIYLTWKGEEGMGIGDLIRKYGDSPGGGGTEKRIRRGKQGGRMHGQEEEGRMGGVGGRGEGERWQGNQPDKVGSREGG